ncbi:RAB23, partial [Symbiodinium necroappetens]
MSESEHQAAAGRAASELASVLSRRRQEVDTKGAFFTKDRKGHADAVWNERTDSQFSPRSSERKSAIARLQGASVSPYASREASPAPQPPEDGRPKVLRRMSADATMTAPNALLEDRARRSFAPGRASTGPVLKAPIQRLGSARSASPTVAPSTSSASPPRTQRPPKAKSKATPRRSASAATEAALPSSRQPQQSPEPARTSAAAALRTGSATEPDLSRPSGRVPAEHGAVAENIAKFEVTQAPQSAVGKLCPKVSGDLGSSTPSEAEEAVPGGGGSASSHSTKEASKPVAKPATKPASKPKAASKSVCKPKAKVAASVGEDPPQRESAQESPRKAVQLPREAVEKDATSSSLRQDPQLGSK